MGGMTGEDRRSQVARKTTLVSVVVNLFLSSAQVLAGVFCGSQGLIADGIHSLSDLVADFVVLLANKKAASLRMTITPTGTGDMKTALPWRLARCCCWLAQGCCGPPAANCGIRSLSRMCI